MLLAADLLKQNQENNINQFYLKQKLSFLQPLKIVACKIVCVVNGLCHGNEHCWLVPQSIKFPRDEGIQLYVYYHTEFWHVSDNRIVPI